MTRSNLDDHGGSGMIIDTRHIVAGYKYFDISFVRAYNLRKSKHLCLRERCG
jgi:hypothetical protein